MPRTWESVVVLRTDGSVLTSRGTPVEWFSSASQTPETVGQAAREACEHAIDDGVGLVTVPAAISGRPVEVLVVAVDAVPLRRTLVSLDELVLRTMDLFVAQARSAGVNPLRGGASNNTATGISCSFDFTLASNTFQFANVGFRCCASTAP